MGSPLPAHYAGVRGRAREDQCCGPAVCYRAGNGSRQTVFAQCCFLALIARFDKRGTRETWSLPNRRETLFVVVWLRRSSPAHDQLANSR